MLGKYNLSNEWVQAMDLEDLIIPSKRSLTVNPGLISRDSLRVNPSKEGMPASSARKQVTNVSDNSSSRIIADNVLSLDELRNQVASYNGCELKKAAMNTVFGDGNNQAKIMIIGEAPGAKEDEHGIPFCGDSGKLLGNMLKSIGLIREQNFYITNTIFWRPPANRAPTKEEIEICRPFVEKHIALINPSLLILVGSTAVTSLLGDHLQISKIRQENYMYSNKYLANPVVTTAIFHPAYLLRQPMQKKTTWYDLLKIKDFILKKGIEI